MPIGTATAISAAASIGSAAIGAHASSSAAKKQINAANSANDLQRGMFDDIRGDLSPYNVAGQGALTGLNRFLSGDPATVQAQLESMPGYQFTRTQGLKAVQNGAAARGLGVSGAAQKGAAQYATGLADSTYGNQFSRMLDLARLGESAGAQTGSFGTQTASNMGNNLLGAGNAAAGGIVGGANAASGALGSLGDLSMFLGYNKLLGGGSSGGSSGGLFGTPVDPFATAGAYGA